MPTTSSLTRKILIRAKIRTAQERWYRRRQHRYALDLSFTDAVRKFSDRNALYQYFYHHFHNYCPREVRAHRSYFEKSSRGFGEDAFHSMWFTLLREFRPSMCLEIGVYRGQVISLWTLIADCLNVPCEVHGISPFAPVGDTVSRYPEDVDYLSDTLASFDVLGLKHPILVPALSTDPAALQHLASKNWDLIYIDGSHDYEVVLADYRNSVTQLKPNGLLIMDDASLGTTFRPPLFAFAGHPGPSRVAAEVAMRELKFLGAVGHNNIFVN
jgi:hypothetical protein